MNIQLDQKSNILLKKECNGVEESPSFVHGSQSCPVMKTYLKKSSTIKPDKHAYAHIFVL